jgi:hypothetical protein
MAPDEAARNVEAIRDMIAQNETWRALQSGAGKRAANSRPTANAPG